jgi:hypothetical protein
VSDTGVLTLLSESVGDADDWIEVVPSIVSSEITAGGGGAGTSPMLV